MAEAVSSEDRRAPGLLESLRGRGVVVVIAILLFAAGALGVSLVQDPSYEASASVLVEADEDSELTESELIAFADSDAVADAVQRRLESDEEGEGGDDGGGEGDGGAIPDRIETAAADVPGVFRIEVSGDDPERVADTATAVAEELADFAEDLDGFAGSVEVVDRAAEPTRPVSPRTVRNTLLGALAGLIVGAIAALAWARLDTRVRSARELDGLLGVPLLARVPDSESLALGAALRELPAADAEAFQMARVGLRYLDADPEIRSVLLTSPEAGDGKTTVAFGLAACAATSGDRVLVVEADVRQPSLDAVVEAGPAGLSTVLAGRARLDEALVSVEVTTGGDGVGGSVDLLLAGPAPANPTRLFESEEMEKLLSKAEERYDLVVIDTPPATILPDAVPLTAWVDGVVVVAGLGQDKRERLVELRERLRQVGAPLVGAIANFAERPDESYFTYIRAHEAAVAEAGAVPLKKPRRRREPRQRKPPAPAPRAVAEKTPADAAAAAETPAAESPGPAPDGPVDLNEAGFDELRALDLSITQAKRLLAYRDRRGGFSAVDEIDDVPGFPDELLEQLKRRLVVSKGG